MNQITRLRPDVKGFFDPRTSSIQYVVSDPATRACVIIDPVLDFDEKSGATGTFNADAILAYVAKNHLTVAWILDTHPHADHFSAAQYLHEKTGAPTAIGERVVDVQRLWKGIYNWPSLPIDGSQWNCLFAHGDRFKVGSLNAHVLFSPGHTLASITYVIGDAAFVHDIFQAAAPRRSGRRSRTFSLFPTRPGSLPVTIINLRGEGRSGKARLATRSG